MHQSILSTSIGYIALTTIVLNMGSLCSIAYPEQPTLQQIREDGAARSRYLKAQNEPTQTKSRQPDLATFEREIKEILKESCVDCHGPDTQEGNIRIDNLDPNLSTGEDVDWWIEIFATLSKEEMPPADATEMSDSDRSKVAEWLSKEIQLASELKRESEPHSSFRRMTRDEYNYALQDLLGLPYDFAKDLPPDPASEDGFKNSSEMLHMSSIQFETYRELARQALQRVTVRGEQPQPLNWGVTMQEASAIEWPKQDEKLNQIKDKHKDDPEKLKKEIERFEASLRNPHGRAYYRQLETGKTAVASWRYSQAKYAFAPSDTPLEVSASFDHVAILPPRQKLIVELGDRIPDRGTVRVRVRAARATTDNDRIPSLQLEVGWQASNDSHASVRVSDRDIPITAAPDQPEFYQWEIEASEIYPRNLVRKISKMGDLPSPSEYIRFVNSSDAHGDIQIDYVEVIGPVYEQWPPKSHERIFGIGRVDGADAEQNDARRIVTDFMDRAWRRPITESEILQKLALFDRLRPQCTDYQETIIEVLATVLSSPKFLYLSQTPGTQPQQRATPNELAARLSMFLWSSIPDIELRKLADNGSLAEHDILMGQVDRMLRDERSGRFTKLFVHQWLNLQLLEYLNADRKLYPHFDPSLKEAMLEEPVAFFEELMANNASVVDVLHCDYTMLNERLARHYGVANIYGNAFRRVSLSGPVPRGGLLTCAGLLAMNSDGKDSHPIKRGIWLLERLLNDPPPPPPPAVPEIDLADPEILKMTLKEQIEHHRDHAACRSCHQKIDPWGVAFENYDAVGTWRSEINGKPVDASSEMFSGYRLDGVEGLKRFLLANRQDQFVRAITHKMATYALGRPLTFADRSDIDEIAADLRQRGDGLVTLVKLIVASDLFQTN